MDAWNKDKIGDQRGKQELRFYYFFSHLKKIFYVYE